jgi:hypothetical protein
VTGRIALLTLLVALALACVAVPASAKDSGECEQLELALRAAAIESGRSSEEADQYAREGAAECWDRVRQQEAEEAQQDAEINAVLEREAVEEAQREEERAKAEKEQRRRETRRELHALHEQERHAREWMHKPTVTRPIAEQMAKRLMRRSGFDIWTVDCSRGKIDRIHWRCTVHIFYHCLRGRIRVTGIGLKDRRGWYRAKGGKLHPCRP